MAHTHAQGYAEWVAEAHPDPQKKDKISRKDSQGQRLWPRDEGLGLISLAFFTNDSHYFLECKIFFMLIRRDSSPGQLKCSVMAMCFYNKASVKFYAPVSMSWDDEFVACWVSENFSN